MSKTSVINVRTTKDPDAVYVGRPSIFGNPYEIGKDGTREEVIVAYGVYFEQRINRDPAFREAVDKLKGKTLSCWCAPLPCHADIIAEWVDGR